MPRKQASAKCGWGLRQPIARTINKLQRRIKAAANELYKRLGALPSRGWQPARVPVTVNGKATIRRAGRSQL